MLHSTREELRANLSAEILFDSFNEVYGDEGHNQIKYICDNKSAVGTLTKDISHMRNTSPLQADMDIILEIERLRNKNNGTEWSIK